MKLALSAVAVAGLSACAFAGVTTITIIGDVTNTTVAGNFGATPPLWSDATAYHFYTFTANAGDMVTFSASRTNIDLDPTVFVYEGNMGGTAFDGTNPFDASPWLGFNLAGYSDDTVDVPGPWGDPLGDFLAPATGTYTVVILSNGSDPSISPLSYTLTVTTPTPGAAAALGLAGVASLRRRRR